MSFGVIKKKLDNGKIVDIFLRHNPYGEDVVIGEKEVENQEPIYHENNRFKDFHPPVPKFVKDDFNKQFVDVDGKLKFKKDDDYDKFNPPFKFPHIHSRDEYIAHVCNLVTKFPAIRPKFEAFIEEYGLDV